MSVKQYLCPGLIGSTLSIVLNIEGFAFKSKLLKVYCVYYRNNDKSWNIDGYLYNYLTRVNFLYN